MYDSDWGKNDSYKDEKEVLTWKNPGVRHSGLVGEEPGLQMEKAGDQEEKGRCIMQDFAKTGRGDYNAGFPM